MGPKTDRNGLDIRLIRPFPKFVRVNDNSNAGTNNGQGSRLSKLISNFRILHD